MGFAKAYNLASISALTTSISKAEGIAWLLTTGLFLVTLFTYLRANSAWWMWAAAAVVFSQVLIIRDWHDAKAGTIANIIVLAAVIIAFGEWRFHRRVQKDIKQILAVNGTIGNEVVSLEMLGHLPEPVKKWVANSGIVGKETIHSVHLKQKGWMRTSPSEDKWIATTAEQYFTINQPGFIWEVQMEMMPLVRVVGEDRYVNGKGRMNIKALSLINIVNDAGEKIDQGTLQRYLAEICWFPSAALSPYIKWEAINDTSARATMEYNGVTGSITFNYNKDGDMISCSADRYKGGGPDARLEKWAVITKEYAVRNGIKMPVKSEVTWKLKSGDYTWYKLEITEIEYNKNLNTPELN
jgi:hypothetical protein